MLKLVNKIEQDLSRLKKCDQQEESRIKYCGKRWSGKKKACACAFQTGVVRFLFW